MFSSLLLLLPLLAPNISAGQELPASSQREARTEASSLADQQSTARQLLYEREVRLAREREMRLQMRKRLGISLARPNRGPTGIPLGQPMVGPYPRLVWARPVIVFEAAPRRWGP